MEGKVLALAMAFRRNMPAVARPLVDAGCEVAESPEMRALQAAELVPLVGDVDAIIAGNDRVDGSVFAAAPQLKIVSRWGIGVDAVDLAAATAHGVVVTNTPGLTANAVADFSFCLMLALARRLPVCTDLVCRGQWDEVQGVDVWGRTLGLIGFGFAGQAMARRARGFAMRTLAYDPRRDEAAAYATRTLFVDLPQLLCQSDFVSIHCGLSDETRGLLSADQFRMMKPTAYVINTARGPVVDELALAAALRDGEIAGAALDVHETEPVPPEHPLRNLPNVILTPHNAFNSVETVAAINRAVAENCLTVLRGERPDSVVNPEVYERRP